MASHLKGTRIGAAPTISVRRVGSRPSGDVARIDRELFPEDGAIDIALNSGLIWPEGFLVAELGGQVVGYLAALRPTRGCVEIWRMGVVEAFRQIGVGGALLECLVAMCKSQSVWAITLNVRKDNVAAMRLYASNQFRVVEAIPHLYPGGADGYRMMRARAPILSIYRLMRRLRREILAASHAG